MRKKLLILFAVLALGTALMIGAPASAQTGGYKLTVLHTSENHGHWEPIVVSNVSQGGIARRATLVKKLRAEIPNTLLVDSGDVSQGTLYFVQYKSQEGRDFYNLLGYDAVSPGNHEFDLGSQVFADNFVSGATFALVNANVDFSKEPILAGKIPPYVIKTVGGEKIGIFGLIIDELPISSNAGANIRMKDALQTAQNVIAELEKQGVNKIILLSHRGFGADLDLAAKVDGIDLIVSGHTETLMGDPAKLDKSLGAPISAYPAVVKTPNGGKSLVVHDFIWGRLLGRIDLTFDDKGQVTTFEGQPIFVDKNIADDPAVAKKLTDLAKPLDDLKKQLIGKAAVDLEGDARVIRNQETNLGDLVADAMVWATAMDKTQIAFMNGGGIRRTIKAGDVSYGDVLEVLPFGNRLVQFDLTGADVVAAIENGISQVFAGGGSAGRFPQIAGLKFSADMNKPVGARVSTVQVGNAQAGYLPLDKNATYRIVTNDFMAGGGDGYAMFQKGKNLNGGDVPLDQALTDYIRFLNAPLAPRVEGRIGLTGAPPPAPTLVPTPTATTAVPAASASATPTLLPTPLWMPLPIPTFSFEPILPRLLDPLVPKFREPDDPRDRMK